MSKTRRHFAVVAVSFFVSVIAEAQGVRPGFNAPETSGRQLIPNAPVPHPDGAPGIDELTPISLPTPDYVSRTTLFDVTAPDYATVDSLTEGDCTVTFTPALQARTVPNSWSIWGSPPAVETPTPRILYTQGAASITLTFDEGCAASTLGFEAEPNPFGPQHMTATYYADAVSLGSITRVVDGAAGARLFAADSRTPTTRVVFYCLAGCDFAIARIRHAFPQGDSGAFGYLSQTVTGVVVADMTTENFALPPHPPTRVQ